MFKNRRLIFPASILVFSLLACNLQSAVPSVDVNAVATAAAGTAAALLGTAVTVASDTPAAPSDTPPGPTATSTNTPIPSVTPICDQAAFVSETIPDGTIYAPGASFTKSWRLRNTGACTWTTSYALVFESGNSMNAPAAIPLAGSVPPGAEVDLPVNMQAPGTPGNYTGYWKLRNGSGVLFGLGATNGNFWAKINVVAPTATWSGGIIVVPLPPLLFAPSTQQVYAQATAPGSDIGHASVACPSGSIVTGGGFAGSSNLSVYNTSMSGNGWQVYAQNLSGSGQLLNAYAICLSNTSGSTQQVLAQISAPGGGIGHATVACPSGSIVTGGGYAGNANLSVYNSSMEGNGWEVYARNSSGSSQLLNAYAICLSDTSGASEQVFSQVSTAGGGIGHATVACPSGSVVTGGGFAANADLFVYNTSGSGNGWETYAKNSSGSSQLLNSYAICTSF